MYQNYNDISYAESPFGTLSQYMTKTFGWMIAGLLVTFACIAWAIAAVLGPLAIIKLCVLCLLG